MNKAPQLHLLFLFVLFTLLTSPAHATPKLAKADPNILLTVGTTAERQGDKKAALDKLSMARNLFKEQGNIAGEAEANLQLGLYHAHYGSGMEAMKNLDKAVSLYAQIKNSCGMARAIAYQQGIARLFEEPATVMKALAANEELARRYRCTKALALTLIETGHLYRKTDAVKAQLYYAEAIELYRTLRDTLGEGHALKGMASLYIISQPARAKKLLNQALIAYDKAMYPRGKALCYLALGVVAMQKADKKGAAGWFTKSKEQAEAIQQQALAKQAESLLEKLYM